MKNNRCIFRNLLVYTILLAVSGMVFPQTSDTWYYGKKIRNIEFKGLEFHGTEWSDNSLHRKRIHR